MAFDLAFLADQCIDEIPKEAMAFNSGMTSFDIINDIQIEASTLSAAPALAAFCFCNWSSFLEVSPRYATKQLPRFFGMAATGLDPLLRLRQSIAANDPPFTTTSPDPTQASDATDDLATATHLQFNNPQHSYSLDTPTRFISSDKAVDLRSIWFAWQKKDVAIPDYIASAQQLNEELAAVNSTSRVKNLVFVERLDLITWLEGASEESEYIKGLEPDASAARSAQVASGAAGGVSTIPSSNAAARTGKMVDPRLQEIYNGERRMGDRNSVLRGIKPTVPFPQPPGQRPLDSTNKHDSGFLPRPKTRRNIPLPLAPCQSPLRYHKQQPPLRSAKPCLGFSSQATATQKSPFSPPRSYHSPFPIRLLALAPQQHQILPLRRHLHAANDLHHRSEHPAHISSLPHHRRPPAPPLHPRGYP